MRGRGGMRGWVGRRMLVRVSECRTLSGDVSVSALTPAVSVVDLPRFSRDFDCFDSASASHFTFGKLGDSVFASASVVNSETQLASASVVDSETRSAMWHQMVRVRLSSLERGNNEPTFTNGSRRLQSLS